MFGHGRRSPYKKIFEPCIVGVLAQQSLTHIKMVSNFWDADGRQHEWIT
jgi:hypothetical protein